MQVKREHSAILSTFIKLPFVIKIFVLFIFEWPFYTGYTVHPYFLVCQHGRIGVLVNGSFLEAFGHMRYVLKSHMLAYVNSVCPCDKSNFVLKVTQINEELIQDNISSIILLKLTNIL